MSLKKLSSICLSFAALVVLCAPCVLQAQQLSDTLNAIFNKHEFDSKRFGPARWLNEGASYTTVEPSATVAKGEDIVEYETATGKRSVLVSAEKLMPTADAGPMKIDDYAWSEDSKQLLIFTNTKKVWRLNTRGDYWVLDVSGGRLKKLGGDAPESSLMFAKFPRTERASASFVPATFTCKIWRRIRSAS